MLKDYLRCRDDLKWKNMSGREIRIKNKRNVRSWALVLSVEIIVKIANIQCERVTCGLLEKAEYALMRGHHRLKPILSLTSHAYGILPYME